MIKIIGGSGFIGTRLSKRLDIGKKKFKIIDKVESKSFSAMCTIADIRDTGSLSKVLNTDDVIINLAAEHRDDVSPKSLYDDVNVQGAKNICAVAEEKGINTIIFTSSVAVYGFAPIGTDEKGEFNPFNDYGRTKLEAEYVYKAWQANDPKNRKLVIIRPTVVFGEQNRGNVYNLLRQIASGKFIMIGDGTNRKSMAYVENIASFLEYSLNFEHGVHIYNYIDKPDFDMNTLVKNVNKILGKEEKIGFRLPFTIGFGIGKVFDFIAILTGKKFTVSSIRVKKFCSDSVYDTSIEKTGFIPPIKLEDALINTVKYEFIDKNEGELFYSE
jgi:nucleoside-diphosphate-sugar epimerase